MKSTEERRCRQQDPPKYGKFIQDYMASPPTRHILNIKLIQAW